MILASIFLCFCLASAFNYLRTRRQRGFVANLKGPFAWPLVGSMHKIVLLTQRNFFQKSSRYLEKYGPLSRCWIFHRLFIPVADLELAKQLLQSESHLETGYELMSAWLGDSLLRCKPEEWSERHQLLANYFRPDNMLQLQKLVPQQVCPELLKHAETRQIIDVWQLVSNQILDCILAINCGVHPSDQYKQDFALLTELYRQRFLNIRSANRFTFWLASPFMRRRQLRLIRSINEANKRFLDQLRPVKNGTIPIDQVEAIQRLQHESLLDVLRCNEKLSEDQILAELNACNYFGYLLCSTSLCFALVQIARHPSVQQKCFQELRTASQGKDSGTPYLNAVLLEALRLHPPQLIVGRELSQDFSYTHSVVGDATLPAGSEVYINLCELQRCEKIFGQSPSQFRPERFLDHPPELLSFGMGSRSCPAQQFSLMLLKWLLTPILLHFELLPHGDALRPNLRFAPGSRNGFQLALKMRQPL